MRIQDKSMSYETIVRVGRPRKKFERDVSHGLSPSPFNLDPSETKVATGELSECRFGEVEAALLIATTASVSDGNSNSVSFV